MWKRMILLTCLFGFFCYNFVLCFYFCNRLKPIFSKNIETIKSEIVFDSSLTCGKKILQIYNETILQNVTKGKSSAKLNSSNTNIRSNDSISTTEGSDQFLEKKKHNTISTTSTPEKRTTTSTPNGCIQHTFVNASTYTGPIVEGWPPSKNRSVELYLNEPFTKLPAAEKLTNKQLIVIVQSRPHRSSIRKSIRKTWAKTANNQTAVLFLMGNDPNMNEDDRMWLMEEQENNNDMIVVDGLIEHYNNLTLKTFYTLKFFLTQDAFQANPPRYLLKVDDDTFVNLPLLYNQLTTSDSYKSLEFLLMGNCFCSNPERHKPIKAKEKFSGKWEVPDYIFNGNIYPSMLSGSGYVMSRSTASCLYYNGLKIPYIHLEDVHITGFAAQSCNISRLHHAGFIPEPGLKDFDTEKHILAHYITSEWRANHYEILDKM